MALEYLVHQRLFRPPLTPPNLGGEIITLTADKFYCGLYSFQRFGESAALGRNVKANIAFARFSAVHRAWIDPHFRLSKQTVAEFINGDAHSRDVHPRKVCAFKGTDLPLRHVFADEIAQNGVISPKILVQFVNPVLALIIGGDEGYGTEWIHVAHLVDIDGTIDAAAP